MFSYVINFTCHCFKMIFEEWQNIITIYAPCRPFKISNGRIDLANGKIDLSNEWRKFKCCENLTIINILKKMGYELHITRREHWANAETSGISLDEWLSYVDGDRELELTNGYSIKIGSETAFQNRPGY